MSTRPENEAANRCIAAARRLALVLVGLGFTGFLISWSEYTQQQRFNLFAYIEKVIAAQQRIDEGNWGTSAEPATRPHFSIWGLRTGADPLNECPVGVSTFPSEGREVEIGMFQSGIWGVEPEKVFLLSFTKTCTLGGSYTGPAVIARLPPPGVWGVALPPDVLKKLRSVALPPKPSRRGFIDTGATVAVDEPARDVRDALYLQDLSALVRRRANIETGRTYESDTLREALDDLLAARYLEAEVLGVIVPSQIAVILLPVIFLGVSVSFWHRVCRIPKDLPDEPWIMLHPNGLVEVFFARAWGILLLAVYVPVTWAVFLQVGANISAEDIALIIGNLAVILAAEIFLFLSVDHILQINAVAGGPVGRNENQQ